MENDYEVNIVSLGMDRDAEASAESQSECGVWTNEKHNSYLDSLENSFVRQLYSLLGREETRRLSRTRHVQSNSHKSTNQFTLLQNGCRHKVDFGKKRAFLATSSEHTIGNVASTRNSLGHEYPARCNAEASGQNFREEVGEKGCDSGVSRKRRREANYDECSLNDQVVP